MGKADAYFEKDGPFKEEIRILRELAMGTELVETLKWGAPVYTIQDKNVVGIMAFKNHYGLWFFNGVYLTDPENLLENAQEGKTKAMRHWKFRANDKIDNNLILEYLHEAIENQKRGLALKPERNKETTVPDLLLNELEANKELRQRFEGLTPYKQREYCEYLDTAKQEKTKLSRLEKILPMIEKGIGFNDQYRKS
ncbi:MAG: YdeI/OmpD-associated family protein [Flavobacteriaceae bacterium]